MRKLIYFISAVLLILIIVGAGAIYFLKNAQKIFVFTQELEPAEVIVVIGSWHSQQTVEHAVDLYKKGYASKIIFSDGYKVVKSVTADIMKDYALQLGVPEADIITEGKSGTTHEEALFVKEILQNYNFKELILVTSDYRSNRSDITFKKVLGAEYKIISNPAQIYSKQEWQNWLKEPRLRSFLFAEIFKYVYFLIFGE